MILTKEQSDHADTLIRCLQMYRIAYDTSPTGSGKTIVATKIAKQLNMTAVVCGSPILQTNWEKTMETEKVPFTFVSIFKPFNVDVFHTRMLVIMDECQLVKNPCRRTLQFMDAVCNHPRVKYVLMLSATPFDHPRHVSLVNRFIQSVADPNTTFTNIMLNMKFTYNTNVNFVKYHVQQDGEAMKLYSDGFRKVRAATRAVADGPPTFNPKQFSAGIQSIHSSLMMGLIRYVQSLPANSKRIVVLKYARQFDEFKVHFPDTLVINGSVSGRTRHQIIETFQSSKGGLLAITDVIGGVGIDLDDQVGDDPRTIITLPIFASDFVQLVGRVRRHNSKSNATVVVIQPNQKKSYFTNQMKTKTPVLQTFNDSLDFIDNCSHSHEHLPTCMCVRHHLPILNKDIDSIIAEFACECAFYM
jgi:superfamily II DNA or RNA helicase